MADPNVICKYTKNTLPSMQALLFLGYYPLISSELLTSQLHFHVLYLLEGSAVVDLREKYIARDAAYAFQI